MDISRITRYTDGRKVKEASTSDAVRVKAEPNTNREIERESQTELTGRAGCGDEEEWTDEAAYCADEELLEEADYSDEGSMPMETIEISDEGKWADEPNNNGDETDIDETRNGVSVVKYTEK